MAKQNLILFTNGFLCVKEGEEFLETELDLLSAEFRSITIYVLNEGPVNAWICVKKIDYSVKAKEYKAFLETLN